MLESVGEHVLCALGGTVKPTRKWTNLSKQCAIASDWPCLGGTRVLAQEHGQAVAADPYCESEHLGATA